MSDRELERVSRGEWGVAAALSLAGIGIAAGSQLLVAAATLPLWYVGAAAFGASPAAEIRVQRQLSVTGASDGVVDGGDGTGPDGVSVDPGDTVTVRTTVENVGAEPIVDLRVVDGVPEALPVVSGTPRTCETLDPGEATTLEYELDCRRGEHAFEDATVRTRNLTGTVAETWETSATGDGTIRCSPAVAAVPLGDGTNDYAGEVPTDEGGSGVEFYAVRDYEPGDPVGSIDWRRYAGTRELATVEYRAERATRIVCVVDARTSQFRAATTARLPAVELSADAAERTFETLVAAGHPTGVVAFHDRQLKAVSPGTDPETRRCATEILAGARESSLGSSGYARSRTVWSVEELSRTLPGEAQVYLFSSFVDDEPVDLVERLRARGYAVRVVSPDVTAGDNVATRLESVDRGTRLARTRATGARVVDWDLERPLGLVLHDAIGGVSNR